MVPVTSTSDDAVRASVRARYAAAARPWLTESGAAKGIDPITSGHYDARDAVAALGLDLTGTSLGCGNPTVLIDLEPGQLVLDLGSGAGLDVLLSARRVAPGGHAFGLDMTEEMLELARAHQRRAGIENATFLRGGIEAIPLLDDSLDVVLSNCVINLAPDKGAVLREAFRVLRPGGRLAVSDVVLLHDVPAELSGIMSLWTGCVSGALRDERYLTELAAAGFADASVEVTRAYTCADVVALTGSLDDADLPAGTTRADVVDALAGAFAAAFVRAAKPA